ncbi:MAG TPA: SMC-Scp complex subunit ScpB, partial [Thermodesulfobacterium commune]|nr:SMC-Scp complex subunit ScpB [Thermodesulfobacterium commune]
RPLLYGTTPFFLEYFGLKSLKDLPPIDELKSLAERED